MLDRAYTGSPNHTGISIEAPSFNLIPIHRTALNTSACGSALTGFVPTRFRGFASGEYVKRQRNLAPLRRQIVKPLMFLILPLYLVLSTSRSVSADDLRTMTLTKDQKLDLSDAVLIEIPAKPDQGFNFPYYLYIPKGVETHQSRRLIVEPNNTGRSNDDFELHRSRAKRLASRGRARRLADRLGTPLLVPTFPIPERIWRTYTHALDRETLATSEGALKRIDLQLVAMIGHCRELLRQTGIPVKPRVFLDGFSASGNFTNRFAALHPEHVRAVASGGVNGLPIFPISSLDGEALPYPIGVSDLKQIADIEFDIGAYKKVSQYIYMGYLDRNDTLAYSDAWNDDERELIKKLFGEKMMPNRWQRSRAILSDLEIPAQCVTYNGTAHRVSAEMQDDIVAFFQSNEREEHAEIDHHQYPFVPYQEITVAHVSGLHWRGDPRIPERFRGLFGANTFAISISEWMEGQDHQQLKIFMGKAGFEFSLSGPESTILIDKTNFSGTVSTDDGKFQAFVVRFSPEQAEKFAAGASYTLHPVQSSKEHLWTVDPSVSLERP